MDNIVIKTQKVNINSVVRDFLKIYESSAKSKNVQIQMENIKFYESSVEVDAARLLQVVHKLIKNAI